MKSFIHSFIIILLFTNSAFAKVPACMDKQERLEFNENQVLLWRDQLPSKQVARAYVRGIIVEVLEDRQNHVHFSVDFDKDLTTPDDRIEIIYNTKFGALPDYRVGDELIACGDFVVDPYSPLKAVIHWLHMSPKITSHEHGFLAINGIITGLINPKKDQQK